jgi:NAD(P)-dependent dehydrogenase (short-subunit alcohol dehydrogenase family)
VLVSSAAAPAEALRGDHGRGLAELSEPGFARRARASLLRARRRGSIIFISSIWGRETGGAGYTLYNASKSALISAARVIAREVAAEGVRVNSIAPGSILAPGGSWAARVAREPEAMAEFVQRELPLPVRHGRGSGRAGGLPGLDQYRHHWRVHTAWRAEPQPDLSPTSSARRGGSHQ